MRVRRQPVRPHRVPADHATSEVLVRALHARVDDVHAHAAARQVAIIVDAVDRAACVPGASDEGKMPGRGKDDKGAVVVSCTAEAVCSCEGSQARRLTVGVNAVDAPRRVRLHAQPASHLVVQVRRVMARRGVATLRERSIDVAVAVGLNREDGRVCSHAHGNLVRWWCVGQ